MRATWFQSLGLPTRRPTVGAQGMYTGRTQGGDWQAVGPRLAVKLREDVPALHTKLLCPGGTSPRCT